MPGSLTTEQLLYRLIPIEQASEHNLAAVANVDILSAILTPSYPPCLFRIQICADTAAKFSARVTKAANTQPVIFNSDVNLTANAEYMFDLLVHDGDTVNFRFDGDVTIRVLRIQEIGAGTQ